MHQLTKDHLEEFLRDPHSRTVPSDFHAHLASCPACAQETRLLRETSQTLHDALSAPDAEPAPGFYARVMNRIEEQREEDSVWTALLEPAFGRRLAIACGTLALLLGTYLASTERAEHRSAPSGIVMTDERMAVEGDGSVEPQQRNAVLVNLVTYRD